MNKSGVVTDGEIHAGMHVTVLEEKEKESKFNDALSISSAFGLQPSKYKQLMGIPFVVESVCLPFIMGSVVREINGMFGGIMQTKLLMPIDLREVTLMEVSDEFYKSYMSQYDIGKPKNPNEAIIPPPQLPPLDEVF